MNLNIDKSLIEFIRLELKRGTKKIYIYYDEIDGEKEDIELMVFTLLKEEIKIPCRIFQNKRNIILLFDSI